MKLTEAQKLEKLREAYYDPKMGLGSVDKLYRKLRSSGITRKEVGTFIKKQQVHQEHLHEGFCSASRWRGTRFRQGCG